MTSTDRDNLVAALRQSREVWLASLAGASNIAQRPGADRWSVLEIAEHVATVENRLMGVIRDAPEVDSPLPIDQARERTFLVAMANREERFNAPDIVQPTGKFQTLEEAIKAFEAARASTIEYVMSCPSLRSKTATHRRFGAVSCYEMALIMSSHATRHAAQVAEVRAQVEGASSHAMATPAS